MRLSIEAGVAAAVAAAFVALTVGAIGREQSRNQAGGSTWYGSTSGQSVNTFLNRQAYEPSLIANTNTEPHEEN